MQDKQAKRKKQSGIPTGNAGEYFVISELLRRGFDTQLADRNTRVMTFSSATSTGRAAEGSGEERALGALVRPIK